jgi:hypothetical protein
LWSSLDQRPDGDSEQPAGRRIKAGCISRSGAPIREAGASHERIRRSHCAAASPAAPRGTCGARSKRAAARTCRASACSIHCIGIALRMTQPPEAILTTAGARLTGNIAVRAPDVCEAGHMRVKFSPGSTRMPDAAESAVRWEYDSERAVAVNRCDWRGNAINPASRRRLAVGSAEDFS